MRGRGEREREGEQQRERAASPFSCFIPCFPPVPPMEHAQQAQLRYTMFKQDNQSHSVQACRHQGPRPGFMCSAMELRNPGQVCGG